MKQFIAVSTFHEGVDMEEVLRVVPEEKLKVAELQNSGRLGQIRMAVPRGKVFLDVFAETDQAALEVVRELPMSKWWGIEVFELSGTA
jgi:muconolactone delta-isomerase